MLLLDGTRESQVSQGLEKVKTANLAVYVNTQGVARQMSGVLFGHL